MRTDLELLEIEIDTLWLKDGRNRLLRDPGPNARPAPQVIAASHDGEIVAIGTQVPEALGIELEAAVTPEPPSVDPARPPVSVARCEQLLKDSLGPVEISSGPSYVISPATAFTSGAKIERSDGNNIAPRTT